MKRTSPIALLLCLALCGCLKPAGVRYHHVAPEENDALHIINFNVEQADAMLILYKGKTLLVDCGSPLGKPAIAAQRIPRRLDALLGHRHIDYFIVTHYHQDHFGSPGNPRQRRRPSGIFSLIEDEGVTIGEIIDRGSWLLGSKGGSYNNYHRALKRWLGTGQVGKRRVARPGDVIDMGEDLHVEVISSAGNGILDRLNSLYPTFISTTPPSENDYSVGIKVTLGDFEMFAAGDLTGSNIIRQYGPIRASYTDIESSVAKMIGPVEVYRVDHHGSAHSSNPCFSQVLHPQVSVFSCGRNNRYGHPAAEVYHRLKTYGDVYITGGVSRDHGADIRQDIVGDDVEILVSPDGARFWINDRLYHSASEQTEQQRPYALQSCDVNNRLADSSQYEVIEGGVAD